MHGHLNVKLALGWLHLFWFFSFSNCVFWSYQSSIRNYLRILHHVRMPGHDRPRIKVGCFILTGWWNWTLWYCVGHSVRNRSLISAGIFGLKFCCLDCFHHSLPWQLSYCSHCCTRFYVFGEKSFVTSDVIVWLLLSFHCQCETLLTEWPQYLNGNLL